MNHSTSLCVMLSYVIWDAGRADFLRPSHQIGLEWITIYCTVATNGSQNGGYVYDCLVLTYEITPWLYLLLISTCGWSTARVQYRKSPRWPVSDKFWGRDGTITANTSLPNVNDIIRRSVEYVVVGMYVLFENNKNKRVVQQL